MSGAYILEPLQVVPFQVKDTVELTVIKGPLFQEVKQVFSDWVTQRIRLYNGQNWVELESDIGKNVYF